MKPENCKCMFDPENPGDCDCCGADHAQPCLHRQSVEQFFDVTNVEHLKAYQHLQQTGVWPRDFWDEMQRRSVKLDSLWEYVIKSKLADAYLKEHLQ